MQKAEDEFEDEEEEEEEKEQPEEPEPESGPQLLTSVTEDASEYTRLARHYTDLLNISVAVSLSLMHPSPPLPSHTHTHRGGWDASMVCPPLFLHYSSLCSCYCQLQPLARSTCLHHKEVSPTC